MGKKILLLTTIYPSNDLDLMNNTNVCHYFTKEWAALGYEVRVIFNYPVYHKIFHKLASVFEKKIASAGSAFITTTALKDDCHYVMDGVDVYRLPLYKFMPKIRVSSTRMRQQIEKIKAINEETGFVPDFVVGHFYYPHLEMVSSLAKVYGASSCIVVHEQNIKIQKIYGDKLPALLNQIDVWGYRSVPLQINFEGKYNPQGKKFLCYSGIPEKYVKGTSSEKTFSAPIRKFIYVGSFIKRKHPEVLVKALAKLNLEPDWSLAYVGDGEMLSNVKQLTKTLNVENHVHFYGRQSRDVVQKIMNEADCFIMASSNESFGLVYLEAMSKGLLVVASRNEGMDGVITHGKNGFLCDAGNADSVSSTVQEILKMKKIEIESVSREAVNTACNLTDKNVAQYYIQQLDNELT